jgi:hypothetical protein
MTVPVRRIRSAVFPELLDDSWPRLLVGAAFWVATALLATVLLIADPVFGSFVLGVPLLVAVLVRERGLAGIPAVLFGVAIGSSLVFGVFLGQYPGLFDDRVLITGFAVFVIWVSTYPVMLAQLDRQYLREHPATQEDTAGSGPAVVRLHVVRAWMALLTVAVVVAAIGRDLLGA